MGGVGSGGRRVGSGRKRKRGVVLQHPTAVAIAPTGAVEPPAELQVSSDLERLTRDLAFLRQAQGPGDPNPQIAELETHVAEVQAQAQALTVWHELAPHALVARTLTPATTAAFVMLCRAVVLERALWASPSDAGGANHRGLMHRIATWKKDFCLSPLGKPLFEATPKTVVKSKWSGLLR